MVEFGGGLVLR